MKKNVLVLLFPVLMLTACQPKSDEKANSADPTADSIPVSAGSLYQLSGNWTDHNGQSLTLQKLGGKVQVVAMAFTHCAYACPRIVADMKEIESQIPNDKREDVGFLLVSFDSERDTAQRLNEFYKEMKLNDNWVLLHGNEQQARELSVLLNVQYEKQQDGNFAHSNIITILNKEGEISYQQQGLGTDPRESVATIHTLLRNK